MLRQIKEAGLTAVELGEVLELLDFLSRIIAEDGRWVESREVDPSSRPQ